MNGILKDIRFSIRVLSKSPGATAVAVLALALGIGANTVTLSTVRSLVLFPLPFHDLDRIMRVWDTDQARGFTQNMVSKGDYLDWRERSRTFEYLAAFNVASGNLTGAGEPQRIEGAVVSADLFPLLGMKPLLGRTFDRTAEQPGAAVVVLSQGLWERSFGADPGIIGRTLSMDQVPFTILGVMPRDFDFPIGAEFWAPLTFTPRDLTARGGRSLFVAGRLKNGVSAQQATAEMSAIARELGQSHREDQGHGVVIRPIREVTNTVTSRFVLVGFAAAAFVLLLGCVNVTNLQLARTTARLHESAVRAALGATRWRIARQVLIENVLLASAAGAVGAVLGAWSLQLERASVPAQVYKWVAGLRSMTISPTILVCTAAASVLAGLLCGLGPAWRASSQWGAATALKQGRGSEAAVGRRGQGSSLVIAEVALAAVLLIAAGLLVATFRRIAVLDVGFNPANLLTMRMNVPWASRGIETTRRFYADVLDRVRALPGVAAAGATNGGYASINSFHISGQPFSEPGEPPPDMQLVTPGFLEALGLPLIKGRTFTADDAAHKPRTALVITASVARRFWKSSGDPIGTNATVEPYDFPTFTIVGIVGDTKDWFTGAPDQTIYVLNDEMPQWSFQLAVRTNGDPRKALPAVRAQAQSIDRTQPVYDAKTMEQVFDEQLSGVRLSAWMMGVFALVALVLAASGVYGVISYSVARRTHEIGIRLALGAEASEVCHHIVARAMRPVLAGIALGSVAALAVARLMSSALYGVVALDPKAFAGGLLLLAVSGFVASYVPAHRASSVDAIVALREE